MATAARTKATASWLTFYRARANELEAENAKLWDFVESVANANMAGWASTEAQEMVRNREDK